jgi:hypothetical protein
MEHQFTCKGCGGPLSATHGQTVILSSTTIIADNNGQIIANKQNDDAWCGDCIDLWNQQIGQERND